VPTPRLCVGPDGWIAGVTHQPSPNRDARPDGTVVELLVIHNISLPPGEFGGDAIAELFGNRLDCSRHPLFADLVDLHVSAHFLVDRGGAITQFVSCAERAWHAGVSFFEGRARCNDFSIGVELEGTDHTPFEDAQYRALVQLTDALRAAYPLRAVRGHCDIAPGRKTDPGPHFDWPRYATMAALPARFLS
jgi:N-acetyl-anhydromuramoyl-L-alanine amidase